MVTHLLQRSSAASIVATIRLAHAIPHANELSVNIFQASRDGITERLLNLFLYQTHSKRTERIVQRVVLAVSDGELERVHLDVDVLDFEDRRIVPVGRDKMNSCLWRSDQ